MLSIVRFNFAIGGKLRASNFHNFVAHINLDSPISGENAF